MSQSSLGRNPFEKRKQTHAGETPRSQGGSNINSDSSIESEEGFSLSRASEWLFVRLPADTLVFAVKTASMMKDSLTKKGNDHSESKDKAQPG